MATFVFSLVSSNIVIGYWNIHGVRNKLENKIVIDWVRKHHIVFISEVKTGLPFSVPGYNVIRKMDGADLHRGGTALLVKNNVYSNVKNILCNEDDIWVKLSNIPDLYIGGAYIPPQDSLYYNEISLAKIQEKCMNGKIVILGDFNGRCGRNISNVLERLELPKKYFYDKDLPDPVEKTNGNAEKLLQLCKDTACLIVNNLHCDKKYFKGSRTFR